MSKALKVDAPAPIKLMDGSSSGPTYLPFARRGNVLLGVKPWGIADGGKYGVPDTTYFAARLRSAPENGLFAEEDKAKKVVKLAPNPANLWDAWPGVTWETKGSSRASTTIGVLLRGKFKGDDKGLQKLLLDEISEGKLAAKFAAYLVKIAGSENLIMREAEIAKWLDSEYVPVIAGITKSLVAIAQVADEMSKNIGVFGMQAAILKKVYSDTKSSGHDAEFNGADDIDENDQDDGEE